METAVVDAASILAIALLTVLSANVADWLVMQRRRFVWVPQRGLGLYLRWACYTVLAATAIARLVGLVPSSVMPWAFFLPFIVLQFSAIWARHASKQPRES